MRLNGSITNETNATNPVKNAQDAPKKTVLEDEEIKMGNIVIL